MVSSSVAQVVIHARWASSSGLSRSGRRTSFIPPHEPWRNYVIEYLNGLVGRIFLNARIFEIIAFQDRGVPRDNINDVGSVGVVPFNGPVVSSHTCRF